jgi:hypothetical protein
LRIVCGNLMSQNKELVGIYLERRQAPDELVFSFKIFAQRSASVF